MPPLALALIVLHGCAFVSRKELVAHEDFDNDGYKASQYGGDDCDDNDASITTGNPWYLDVDGDSFGDTDEAAAVVCPGATGPAGYVPDDGDCNDNDATISPNAQELCDDQDVDEDCDGASDDADDSVDSDGFSTFYADGDADTFGDPGNSVAACDLPDGFVTNADDCDDTTDTAWPGAVEVCDGIDNNCDDTVDEASEASPLWYEDTDADGHGNPDRAIYTCATDPAGYAADATDCDDTDPAVNPGASERCNLEDDDCDGTIDEDSAVDAPTWYWDGDADGYGDESTGQAACTAPAGTVDAADGLDCDDANGAVHPHASERCDGVDHDCDGLVNEDDSTDATTWYTDGDADGYGVDDGLGTTACSAPAGTAASSGDCDDADPAYNPGAAEPDCTDPADYNCDGSTGYANADGDAYAACVECDDTDPDNHPGAAERCDGVDNNCDGAVDEDAAVDAPTWYADADSDGFGDPLAPEVACAQPAGTTTDATDCDDTSAMVAPGAPEYCDGVDHDCDGAVYEVDSLDVTAWFPDADADGFGVAVVSDYACLQPAGWAASDTDCADNDPAVNPGGIEVCNALDDDCDGLTDDADPGVDLAAGSTFYADADGDTYGDASTTTVACAAGTGWTADDTDCDDTDASLHVDADADGTCDAAVLADYTDSVNGIEMIAIAAGTFTMGGGKGDPTGAQPDHEVTLTHAFWIGMTEVTHAQWEADPDNTGWAYWDYDASHACSAADCPANNLAWRDAALFANWLSSAGGVAPCYSPDGSSEIDTNLYDCAGYRLPTEAEWEFAARGGVNTEYSGGDTATDVAWIDVNGDYRFHQVCTATLAENAFGLCDMSGNVAEWVNDYYGSLASSAATDPDAAYSGSPQFLRGGDWVASETYAQVGFRSSRDYVVTDGLRLARTIPTSTDTDADGDPAIADGGSDCDDNDATIDAGAPETCNDGIDQDCDGSDLAC